MASARFTLEMSQPPRTMSLGFTMGSSLLKGTNTSSPLNEPTRQVDDCVSDP